MNEIAEDEGLVVIYDDYGKATFDGMTWYEPDQDEFFIHMNTARGNTKDNRKGRFTLAHEFGHYFIDHHRHALKSGKMQPHLHRYIPFGNNEEWEIEREADDFAAQLLMPLSQFREEFRGHPFSCELLREIADKYQVSFSACALRYISLKLVPVMLVYAEEGKVKWQKRSDDFPFYRLRYGTNKVPENTVMGDYFYNGDTSCSRQPEIVYAEDCFHTYNEEQNRVQFYECCIPYEKCAFSVFWEK
ncbi:MAG: ImmA/IrrE family metallo-endopeptidase [Prevotellaceae bacterium]|nr:ImmA/IrrE family metallo-endopeptidase [Prevotellaceae bacterium]